MADLYTTAVVANLLGVHAKTVILYCQQGVIEPYKLQNGHYVFDDRHIETLKAHREALHGKTAAA